MHFSLEIRKLLIIYFILKSHCTHVVGISADKNLLKLYGGGDKIVQKTRNSVWIADRYGNVSHYVKVVKTTSKNARANPRKISLPTKHNHDIRESVSSIRKCSVVVENMSPADIEKKIAQVERSGRIRTIENKLTNLSCKKFPITIYDTVY